MVEKRRKFTNMKIDTMASMAALLTLIACASHAETSSTGKVSLYTAAGSRQCQGGGQTADQVRQKLEQAGVKVLAASCGHDGRMYASVCGGADGRIVIVDVAARDEAAARSAGFAPLTELPDAKKRPCG
jgi:hypothetical protein